MRLYLWRGGASRRGMPRVMGRDRRDNAGGARVRLHAAGVFSMPHYAHTPIQLPNRPRIWYALVCLRLPLLCDKRTARYPCPLDEKSVRQRREGAMETFSAASQDGLPASGEGAGKREEREGHAKHAKSAEGRIGKSAC